VKKLRAVCKGAYTKLCPRLRVLTNKEVFQQGCAIVHEIRSAAWEYTKVTVAVNRISATLKAESASNNWAVTLPVEAVCANGTYQLRSLG
jgi:hypothetical protein